MNYLYHASEVTGHSFTDQEDARILFKERTQWGHEVNDGLNGYFNGGCRNELEISTEKPKRHVECFFNGRNRDFGP